MQQKTIIANWKCNLTRDEIISWIAAIDPILQKLPAGFSLAVAPPTIYLELLKNLINSTSSPLSLCAQDVSSFTGGARTGEVNATQLSYYTQYCLVGHSERRVNFRETNSVVRQKAKNCLAAGIHPIICVSDKVTPEGLIDNTQSEPDLQNFLNQVITVITGLTNTEIKKIIVMYEPSQAISVRKGNNIVTSAAKVQDVISMIQKIKTILPSGLFFYGGSVDETNVQTYLATPDIHGVIIGSASLNTQKFSRLLNNVYAVTLK